MYNYFSIGYRISGINPETGEAWEPFKKADGSISPLVAGEFFNELEEAGLWMNRPGKPGPKLHCYHVGMSGDRINKLISMDIVTKNLIAKHAPDGNFSAFLERLAWDYFDAHEIKPEGD